MQSEFNENRPSTAPETSSAMAPELALGRPIIVRPPANAYEQAKSAPADTHIIEASGSAAVKHTIETRDPAVPEATYAIEAYLDAKRSLEYVTSDALSLSNLYTDITRTDAGMVYSTHLEIEPDSGAPTALTLSKEGDSEHVTIQAGSRFGGDFHIVPDVHGNPHYRTENKEGSVDLQPVHESHIDAVARMVNAAEPAVITAIDIVKGKPEESIFALPPEAIENDPRTEALLAGSEMRSFASRLTEDTERPDRTVLTDTMVALKGESSENDRFVNERQRYPKERHMTYALTVSGLDHPDSNEWRYGVQDYTAVIMVSQRDNVHTQSIETIRVSQDDAGHMLMQRTIERTTPEGVSTIKGQPEPATRGLARSLRNFFGNPQISRP
jgi:hypothetical protein